LTQVVLLGLGLGLVVACAVFAPVWVAQLWWRWRDR
jgi:hypothetical protein